jgi:Ca2+-transporting ATPase
MNTLFHTVPLAPVSLLPLAALASSVLWAEELRKLTLRLRHRRAA